VPGGAFSTVFFWDTLFTSAALADFDPEFARGAIRTAFVRQLERDGASPEDRRNWSVPERKVYAAPQAPIGSWAVERYLARRGAEPAQDRRFLAEMWPKLVANHRYWRDHGDRDHDGLAEWTWGGQTADDSPIYDQFTSGKNSFLPPVASVSLNSFLYQDATILARLAKRLGRADEAAGYRKRADAIAEAMMRWLYVPAEKRFWDWNHHTLTHRRVRTFYLFWPIVCGVPVPRAAKKELIERVLLDPKQFFGPIPFPSVAYDEPTYEPGGYWRGKAWPHITYWIMEMLAREGYGDEAEIAAQRVLGLQSSGAFFRENMNTDPGEGAPGGAPDYNWGVAGFYLIATGAYRKTPAGV
jgi:glycogen debranching enzyme